MIVKWLSGQSWSKSSLLTTNELVKQTTGDTLNASYFKEHLRNIYL
ncbi:hypothetical protein R5D70_003280 [Vibrio parahaemolyticus]|nr:hypothetical protein [Vibrio parahaemolyticus]ELS3153902.1 hypothetical protein [Vibrio parahaemolyticus]